MGQGQSQAKDANGDHARLVEGKVHYINEMQHAARLLRRTNQSELASRIEACIEMLREEEVLEQVNKSMGEDIHRLGAALTANDVEVIAEVMTNFEKQFASEKQFDVIGTQDALVTDGIDPPTEQDV